MQMKLDINANVEIKELTDLPKLKLLMESAQMKINKSQLAREHGVDRRTIEKYLNGYTRPKSRKKPSRIDDLYEVIKELLSEESIQKFYYKRVLWQYLKDNHNLDCSSSNFRTYISRRPEFQKYFKSNKGRENNSSKGVMRYETSPAEQGQLDWKEDIKYITRDKEVIYINVLVLTLAYSRMKVYQVSLSKSQNVLLSILTEAFELLGGVPQTLLVDNMKTVMDQPRTKHNKGKVNNRFSQFAKDFGFEVKPCMARRPQTKGKIESTMKLVDEIHAYQGEFNYEELCQYVQKLCNRINHQHHQGSGKIPILHFEKEKNLLSSLPRKQIRDEYRIKNTLVKINESNMFSYKSNQYSVPSGFIGKHMNLQIYDDHIHVYYNTKLIVRHKITSKKLNYKEEHYIEGLRSNLPYMEDVDELAIKNLNAINEVYGNE